MAYCFKDKIKLCEDLIKNFEESIFKNTYKNIYNNYIYTKNQIERFSEELNKEFSDSRDLFSIILVGSFGRLESSQLSDLDYCILYDDNIYKINNEFLKEKINKKLKIMSQNKISCFSDKYFNEIISNIGGKDDKSMDFTTRILILLESIPLLDNSIYNKVITSLSDIYLEEFIAEKKYPLFLTNEIIRFWRTLCIDYRWKKVEGEKPWGIRNIKLRFSRKLLCFSSILLLIMLYKKLISYEDFKIYINCPSSIKLLKIFDLISNHKSDVIKSDLKRKFEEILTGYDEFLGEISTKNTRDSLEEVEFEKRNKHENYVKLKEKAKIFHENIIRVLIDLDIDILNKYLLF